jgi:hypothetical protein
MEMSTQSNSERGPINREESFRLTKVTALRREIAALEAQKSAKEQELRQLQDEPKLLLDFSRGTDRSSVALRPEDKIALFLELFGARCEVYPKFWESSSSGKKGYSPAYSYNRGTSASLKHFLPLDEGVVEGHLRGHQPIGVYALRKDDSCIFLAADFDGEGWRENVLAYKEVAQKSGVMSRSNARGRVMAPMPGFSLPAGSGSAGPETRNNPAREGFGHASDDESERL